MFGGLLYNPRRAARARSPRDRRVAPRQRGGTRAWSPRFLLPLLLALCAACGSDDSQQSPAAPNIVFIFADDLGYGDLSSYGNTAIDTPNIDRIAAEGVRFTQFYAASSICTPSRAALLTGRYPVRFDLGPFDGTLFPFSANGLDPAELTIAEVLRQAGYTTALVGKWHLGHLPPYLPGEQGFDLFYGTPYSNDMDAPHYPGQPPPVHGCNSFLPDCRPGVPLMENGAILEMPAIQETLTERYTQKATAFMRQTVAAARPFFLYYASNFPHTPLYASDAFFGRSDGGLYGDVVEELDASVGEILAEIERLGIAEDTLVVFSSDNGPWLLWATDAPVPQGGLDAGSAGALRNGKSTTFEGGVRVPLVARWPGRIPGGRTIDAPAAMLDWMPTFAKLAAVDLPADLELDGADIMPLLSGRGVRDQDDFRYLQSRSSNRELGGYREGRWKLKLAVEGGESVYARFDHGDLLFDLNVDPGELDDRAAAMPDMVAAMKQRMGELAAAVDFAPQLGTAP